MMPGPGDQHKGARTSLNPFEEVKPHITEYTAKEIATLQSRLEKQLGPEYISSRPGAAGQKVHYLAADKCINLANEVFGFNGWSSGIQNIQIDFVDESQSTGKVSLGLSVIVRVTLRDGTYHEDIGYGHIENCKGKAAAFEKAKKEGTTDALKRALRNFGNILGNCIYDKDYVSKVTKLKVAPSKWDPNNLHRHPDYAPVKKEYVDSRPKKTEYTQIKSETLAGTEEARPNDLSIIASSEDAEDEFGSDEFDEADFSVAHHDHPDEVSLDVPTSSEDLQRPNGFLKRGQMTGHQAPQNRSAQQMRPPDARTNSMATDIPPKPRIFSRGPDSNSSEVTRPADFKEIGQKRNDPLVPQQQGRTSNTWQSALSLPASQNPSLDTIEAHKPASGSLEARRNSQSADSVPNNTPPPITFSDNVEHDPPIGFFTARAAESVQNVSGMPLKAPAFNPHLESPSIRKTAGVDHTKTKPVEKEAIGVASPASLPPRSNFINPQADRARRVGMPVGAASPLQNRNSYRPPQMKRPAEMNMAQNLRPALGDVTSATVNVPSDAGVGLKRQKLGNTMGFVGTGVNQENGHVR